MEKYIRVCIDSVLSQSEQDFEIVLCDDGSTDSSGTICDEYQAKYPDKIRVIHKENEGLLLTRRRAIKEAKGEWFVHLDSDDYMMPDALKAIKEVALKNDVDLVLTKVIFGQKNEQDFSVTSNLPFKDGEIFDKNNKNKLLMQFLYGGQLTAIYQKIARRDIVDIDADYTKWKSVSMMEDHLQSMPLLDNSKKAVFLDKAIIYYRFNESSITKQKHYSSYESAFWSMHTVYCEEKRYRELWGLNNDDNAKICAKHLRKLCLIIENAVKAAKKSDQKTLKLFIKNLSSDDLLREDYKTADRQVLGKKARWCFKLIFCKNVLFLKALLKIVK